MSEHGGKYASGMTATTIGDFKLDRWQHEVLETKGNIAIRAGRQVGKSTIIAIKTANYVVENPGHTVLVIAAAQRQAGWLFEKILNELSFMAKEGKINFEKQPTKTEAHLKNGAKIYCLPAGKTGNLIRGPSIDIIIADEAAYIPEVVWTAVVPMLAVSRKLRGRGWIILLSTPFGKGGYFYNAFNDPDFRTWHINSEKCPRIPKKFLQKEKNRLSKEDYAQEYEGEFVDDFRQFFPTQVIKKCEAFVEWDIKENMDKANRYYLGVDVARYGEDENAMVVAEMDKKNNIRIVKALTSERKATTDTSGHIQVLDKEFDFRRIFIDDAGVGAGLTDALKEKLGRKVVGINNAKRAIDSVREKGILKEDLYSNALILMEADKLEMISDIKLIRSLKSMRFEYTAEKNVKIFGRHSHLAEAFVRACWCIKDVGRRPLLA